MQAIAKGTTESKDGKTTYYRVTILQGMESGMLSCTQDVYDNIEVGKTYDFNVEYNGEYKSFRVVGIAQNPTKSNATVPPNRADAPAK